MASSKSLEEAEAAEWDYNTRGKRRIPPTPSPFTEITCNGLGSLCQRGPQSPEVEFWHSWSCPWRGGGEGCKLGGTGGPPILAPASGLPHCRASGSHSLNQAGSKDWPSPQPATTSPNLLKGTSLQRSRLILNAPNFRRCQHCSGGWHLFSSARCNDGERISVDHEFASWSQCKLAELLNIWLRWRFCWPAT
jgi:hypothetical protein